MRTRFALAAAVVIAVIGSAFVIARSPGPVRPNSPPSTAIGKDYATGTGSAVTADSRATTYSGMRDSQTWERTRRASRIIGMDVVNRHGEKVGDVEDIVFDDNGNIAYAIVSTGGFIGVGDRLHAIPWNSLRASNGADTFILDIERDRLRGAPGFDQSNWPNINDPKWASENRRHFPPSSRLAETIKTNPASGR